MATYANKLKGFVVMRLEKSMVFDNFHLKHLFSGEGSDHAARKMNEAIAACAAEDSTTRNLYAQDPASSAWLKYGFARIMDALPFVELEWEDDSEFDPNDTVFMALDNNRIFGILERRERILPGDTLRAEIETECNKLAKKQGQPVNRKQRMEIKDVVSARLLAKSLVRTRRIPVLFQESLNDPDTMDVFYFTTSHKIVEDLNAALFRPVFGSYPVRPFENDLTLPVKLLLTFILKHTSSDDFPWDYFVPALSAKLVDNKSGGSAYSFKDQVLRGAHDDFDPLVKEALDQGYVVENMAMRFWPKDPIDAPTEFVSFKMTAKGVFSGLKISDVLVAEQGSVEDDSALMDFNAYMFLLADVLQSLIGRLEDTSSTISPERVHDDEDTDLSSGEDEADTYNEDDEL